MTLLVTGCMAIAVLLILGTVVATSAQLARVRLLDVVDGAALDAADALDTRAPRTGPPRSWSSRGGSSYPSSVRSCRPSAARSPSP